MRNKTCGAVLGILLLVFFLFIPMIDAQDEETDLPPAEPAAVSEEPLQTGGEPVATLIFSNTKLDQIMMHLKKQTGINVVTVGKVSEIRMDVIAQNEPVTSILQKIASQKNLVVVRKDNMNYELMDEPTYIKERLPEMAQRKVFILKHIKAEDARKALQNVLTKGIGQMAADPRTNKLIITDLPQVIELIKRLLDEIDVQLIWRAFYIRHADVAAIADKLKNYKSGPGTIEVDPKTHQIIVYDIFQNIKRMEMLVEVLDVGPEIRVYNLNNIGIEGKIAQQLSKAIEQVITKDADVFWQIDDQTGTLVVQDVPEVHEKIEQILAALDQPLKQVLIYAELIDTSFNRSYDFGIKWDISEDFFSAARDGLFSNVPTGSSGDLTDNLGFLNLHEEFPTFSMGGNSLLVGYLNKYFRANLNAALTKSDTRILLQPRFIVKNQQEVKIKVGGNKPYRTTNYYTDNRWQSSGQASISYGLEVTMTPSISNNGLIEMEIFISNSDASFIGDVNENPLVESTEVSASTILIIPNGETRVLAGLINNSDSDSREGIPFLVEIPIIGPALFGKKSEKDTRRNILFFVTPTIIEEKPNNKDYYRGKSIQELTGEGKLPSYLDELTSPSLAGKKFGESEMFEAPQLSSDRPEDLKRLLGDKANLDLETLRQERLSVTMGPEGDFSSTPASPSTPPPPPPTPRTTVQRGEPSQEEPPPETKDDKEEEEPPSDESRSEGRPYRPAPSPETKY